MPSLEIFLDLETLPTSRPEVQERYTADVAPPANYKSADAIAKWWTEHGEIAKTEAVAKTALSGTFGELLCIGYAVNDGPVNVLVRADNEADLIRTFVNTLDAEAREAFTDDPEWWLSRAVWIGHNIEDFDLRFLWQRACVHGVKFPFPLPLDRYPKAPRRFDTMKEWGGWNGRVKQRDLEMAFGLERHDPLTHGGADVWAAYQAGDTASVVAHCSEDVRLLREIYRRLS
jgi:3'-5' exonuclease